MRLIFFKVLCSLSIILIASLESGLSSAQTGATVRLLPPQMDDYPTITALLDVHDASGNFIPGLKEKNLKVIENGIAIPASQIVEISPGVQFVLAVSLGHALSIRDSSGFSRFDYLMQGLSAWKWDAQSAGSDDLSLITVAGPELVHTSDPAAFLSALQTYQPNLRNSLPNLEVLGRALQVAEDDPPRPGMERAVLFITPLQPAEASAGLQTLAARASQLGVRIFVWLVAPPEATNSPEAAQLQNLASQTGGSLFLYTDSEAIPNIETYLEPLRYIYSFSYSSSLTNSGTFPVQVEVTLEEQTLTSNTQEIVLEILPPNPIFRALPAEISRKLPDTSQINAATRAAASLDWSPDEQTLQVLIEFPDGHPRPIVQSVLYVDGAPVQVNTAPPFEKFTWDLQPYIESGSHTLQVEVTDHLGLTGRSLEIPIQITVEQPKTSIKLLLSGRGLLLAGALVIFSGITLVLVLILGGRIQPRQPGKPSPARRKASSPSLFRRDLAKTERDPVRQPLQIKADEPPPSPTPWTLRLQRLHPHSSSQIYAFLTPLIPSDELHPEAPIPITTNEVIFGSDPLRSTWVIEDASLEGLHARLIREGNTFRLSDAGTLAGTWINYAPVSKEGCLLENGDVIHIGRTGFRFSLRAPGKTRKPVILNQEPDV